MSDHDPSADYPDSHQLSFAFHVNLEGFEGPLDVLLHLARQQKVDLLQVSIVDLADQYAVFIEQAKTHDLALAADYLVMAAWLAFLKSRLLLPREEKDEDDLSPQDLEIALAHRLKLLQAMQKAGKSLMERPQRGRDVFSRPIAHDARTIEIETHLIADIKLFDLLKAYGDIERRKTPPTLKIPRSSLVSVEQAVERIRRLLSVAAHVQWVELLEFIPQTQKRPVTRRSALASTFAASLDLAKRGEVEILQNAPFAALYLRPRLESV